MSTIECFVWWTTLLPVAKQETHLPLLDNQELKRYHNYQDDTGRRRFLSGRTLAKHAVGQCLGEDAAHIRFDASCPDCGKLHGPPRLPGNSLRLSISHSGDRVGVAIADNAAVGLDVESTQRQVSDSLIAYALNAAEKSAINQIDTDGRKSAFFTYWTRKEALMKASLHGLHIPLHSLTVSGADKPAKLENSTDSRINARETQLVDLDPGEGYNAALAVLTDHPITVTQQWWPREI